MALAGCSTEALASTKSAYEAFLADPANLAAVRQRVQARAPRPAVGGGAARTALALRPSCLAFLPPL